MEWGEGKGKEIEKALRERRKKICRGKVNLKRLVWENRLGQRGRKKEEKKLSWDRLGRSAAARDFKSKKRKCAKGEQTGDRGGKSRRSAAKKCV